MGSLFGSGQIGLVTCQTLAPPPFRPHTCAGRRFLAGAPGSVIKFEGCAPEEKCEVAASPPEMRDARASTRKKRTIWQNFGAPARNRPPAHVWERNDGGANVWHVMGPIWQLSKISAATAPTPPEMRDRPRGPWHILAIFRGFWHDGPNSPASAGGGTQRGGGVTHTQTRLKQGVRLGAGLRQPLPGAR